MQKKLNGPFFLLVSLVCFEISKKTACITQNLINNAAINFSLPDPNAVILSVWAWPFVQTGQNQQQ